MGYISLGLLDRFTAGISEKIDSLFVRNTRKINGKSLDADITLSAAEIGAIAATAKGAANGIAELDAAGKVPTAQLPSDAWANVQSDWNITDTASDAFIKNKPSSLPANGGNASTVNGYTVNANVPAGAKFTDTTYNPATTGAAGLMSATDKVKLDGMVEASTVDIDNIIAGIFS